MTLGGTVLITGPTGGLGTVLALELAKRGASERPDLLLVGRAGERLTGITDAVRAAGATEATGELLSASNDFSGGI